MYQFCDACAEPLTDEACTVQIQDGSLTRMADGTPRMNGRVPRQHILCRACGDELTGVVNWMLADPDRKKRPRTAGG